MNSCEFAARHHLGLGVAYGPFEAVGKATRYYRDACHGFGWQPAPEQIIYRANILLAASDEEAQDLMKIHRAAVDSFPLRPAIRESLLQLDSRNIAGERRPAMLGGVLPTNFMGGPDTVVEQIKRCRDQVGAGVIDLMFQTPDFERSGGRTDAEARIIRGKDPVAHTRRVTANGHSFSTQRWPTVTPRTLSGSSQDDSPSLRPPNCEAGTSCRCVRLP